MLLPQMLHPHLAGPEHCVTTSTLVLPLIKAMSCYHSQTCHDRHACHLDSQVDHKDVVDIKTWFTTCGRQ